jgi:hypothetical protein
MVRIIGGKLATIHILKRVAWVKREVPAKL